jgi:hypothetical protein
MKFLRWFNVFFTLMFYYNAFSMFPKTNIQVAKQLRQKYFNVSVLLASFASSVAKIARAS